MPNHVLRGKAGTSLGIALLLKFVCNRVAIQVDVIHDYERETFFLGVTPESPSEPCETVYSLLTNELLSPNDCQELMACHDHSQCTPLELMRGALIDLRILCQIRRSPMLMRSTQLWLSVLSRPDFRFVTRDPFMDPTELSYKAHTGLASRLDASDPF